MDLGGPRLRRVLQRRGHSCKDLITLIALYQENSGATDRPKHRNCSKSIIGRSEKSPFFHSLPQSYSLGFEPPNLSPQWLQIGIIERHRFEFHIRFGRTYQVLFRDRPISKLALVARKIVMDRWLFWMRFEGFH